MVRNRRTQPLPILHVGAHHLEWLSTGGDGQPLYVRAPAPETPEAVGAAAAKLVREAGGRPGACVVSLGGGLVRQRVLSLGALSGKELRGVLLRKASGLLETQPADAVYTAAPLADAEGASAGRWLLLALRRSESIGLAHSMREHGFRLRGVVSGRLAALSCVETDDESAAVVVSVEHEGVAIALLRGRTIVQQTFLVGDYARTPAMAAAVVQELRGFDAFWRRFSRGQVVARVVLLGMTPESGAQLSAGAHAALSGAEVSVRPGPADALDGEDHGDTARRAFLAACRDNRDARADLNQPLPPRRSALLLVACTMTAIALWGGLVIGKRLRGQRALLQADIERLAPKVRDFGAIEDAHARIEAARARLAGERARTMEVGGMGLPLDGILSATLTAFGNGAALTSFGIEHGERGTEVQLSGVTDPDPLTSLARLSALRARLAESPHFRDVELDPPTAVPGGDRAGRQRELSFTVRARLREGS